ncbi:carboxymuconolactone decarboxylase family protein [Herbaspirillum sp. HC18]|nr:carboxymuconolactone decarboxylase family protein [Herbaspirillum sp. HC18]
MNDLAYRERERELVALGAAMGSNCIFCIEHIIPKARKAGLTDSQIFEAIQFADRVRQVPAHKVLNTALRMVAALSTGVSGTTNRVETAHTASPGGPCCG